MAEPVHGSPPVPAMRRLSGAGAGDRQSGWAAPRRQCTAVKSSLLPLILAELARLLYRQHNRSAYERRFRAVFCSPLCFVHCGLGERLRQSESRLSSLVCDCESMHHEQGQESQEQDASYAITSCTHVLCGVRVIYIDIESESALLIA